MSDEWECSSEGCKTKDIEYLYSFTEHGDNKNKNVKGWFCKTHFDELEKDGQPHDLIREDDEKLSDEVDENVD